MLLYRYSDHKTSLGNALCGESDPMGYLFLLFTTWKPRVPPAAMKRRSTLNSVSFCEEIGGPPLYALWAFSWPLQSSWNNRAVHENDFCLRAEAGKKYLVLGFWRWMWGSISKLILPWGSLCLRTHIQTHFHSGENIHIKCWIHFLHNFSCLKRIIECLSPHCWS